jgi:hypothetical protein
MFFSGVSKRENPFPYLLQLLEPVHIPLQLLEPSHIPFQLLEPAHIPWLLAFYITLKSRRGQL